MCLLFTCRLRVERDETLPHLALLSHRDPPPCFCCYSARLLSFCCAENAASFFYITSWPRRCFSAKSFDFSSRAWWAIGRLGATLELRTNQLNGKTPALPTANKHLISYLPVFTADMAREGTRSATGNSKPRVFPVVDTAPTITRKKTTKPKKTAAAAATGTKPAAAAKGAKPAGVTKRKATPKPEGAAAKKVRIQLHLGRGRGGLPCYQLYCWHLKTKPDAGAVVKKKQKNTPSFPVVLQYSGGQCHHCDTD